MTFLPDGRMVIDQLNSNTVPIDVKLGISLGFIPLSNPEIYLQIPQNGLHLQYLGEPIKQ